MREITRKVSSIWTRFRAEVIFIHVLTKLDFHYSRQIIHLWKECSSFEISFFSSLGRHKNEKNNLKNKHNLFPFFFQYGLKSPQVTVGKEGKKQICKLRTIYWIYWPLFAMLLFSFPIIKHRLFFNELF